MPRKLQHFPSLATLTDDARYDYPRTVDISSGHPCAVDLEDPHMAQVGAVPPPPPRSASHKFFDKLPSVTLVLPNTESVARDHLASERTWLAYVRTSLGIAGTGVALVQLFSLGGPYNGAVSPPPNHTTIRNFARPLGAATVFFGLYVLLIGVHRFFAIQHALIHKEFPVARLTVVGITGVLTILVTVTFGILIAVPAR